MKEKTQPNTAKLSSQTQGATHLLRSGIAAFRAGQTMHARNLLMRAIHLDAGNAMAWLWLSQVLRSKGGRKFCLERAFALKLTNSRAHRKLTRARKEFAGELLQKSIAAIRAGQHKRAYNLLRRAIREHKGNVQDWLRSSKAAVNAKLSTASLGPNPADSCTPSKKTGTGSSIDIIGSGLSGLGWHDIKRALVTSLAPVTLIVASTVVLCLSLLATGSVMARTTSLPDVNLEAPPALVAQAPIQTATPPPTSLPTSVPPTIEPTTLPPTLLPTPTVQPTLAPYPPTRIVILSLGINATVVPTKLEVEDVDGIPQPRWAVPEPPLAGWHESSASLGGPGNTVINGHNWPRDAAFRNLHNIQPGEQIILFSNLVPFTYEAAEVVVLSEAGQPPEVKQANTRYIQPTDDERVTLVTCYPYGSTRDRLVVIAYPVEDS